MSIDITQHQRIWLDKLQEVSKKPILVKNKEGEMPAGANPRLYNWMPYKDVWGDIKEPIYTRSILPNEILLDPDVKDWNTLKFGMGLIKTYCERENIPLYLAYSGGNGIHGDIVFNDKELMIDEDNLSKAKKYDIDLYKIVRKALTDIIFSESGANRMSLAIDTKKINFSKDRMGSMVREYGTIRPNGNYKTLITTIPENKPAVGSLPLIFPEKVQLWNIPKKYNKKINDEIKREINKAIDNSNYNIEHIELKGNKIEKFPCLKTLLKIGASAGNRYYGACGLVLMAKQCGYSRTATTDLIRKFFGVCEITPAEAALRIDNSMTMFDGSDYHFSCATIKETFGHDVCDFKNCVMCEKAEQIKEQTEAESTEDEIPQHIRDKAAEILEAGSPIPYLMKVYNNLHVGDVTTGKALLGSFGSQSVVNSSGIQPKLSGNSGKGKTHAAKAILHLVPRKYVLEASLSDKAIYHADIPAGTILFSDDVEISEELQAVIKRATTNFQTVTDHLISVKQDGEWGAKKVSIPPRVIWCLTSVNDNGSMEFLNRQFNLGVDETQEQDKDVMAYHLKRAVTGEPEYPINDDVLACRAILDDIKTKLFTVTIPYAEKITWNDPENRRNLPQFLDLIKAFAVFDYRHRVKINDNTIEANKEDFDNALSLYSKRAVNQKFKLNDNELAIIRKMEQDRPYYIEHLQELTHLAYMTVYRAFHGRDNKNGGLLQKVPGLIYAPETEFIGETETAGSGSFEYEKTITKKTRPKHVYVLKNKDLINLSGYGNVAALAGV